MPAGKTKCSSGVGRKSVYTTWQGERCVAATHPANSAALGSVADRKAMRVARGASAMASSHTTPRSASRR